MDTFIRAARADDAGQVLKLLYQVNKVHSDGRPDLFKAGGIKYDEAALMKLFEDESRPVFVCVQKDTGRILGYVFCVIEEQEDTTSIIGHRLLYIDDLCVDETARRTGVGEKLYHYACDYAKSIGISRITLHVWELNPGARRFYEKMGMVPVCTTMEAYVKKSGE